MVDKEEDDDSFLQQFMARAKKRQAKLSQINDVSSSSEREVSYPALSPLPEEESTTNPEDETHATDDLDSLSNILDKEENVSPSHSNLNYSSDLSLDDKEEFKAAQVSGVYRAERVSDVYRAEPVRCHPSPDHSVIEQLKKQPSPRKQAPTAPSHHDDIHITPLHEIQPDQKPSSSHSLPETSSTEQTIKDLQLKVDRAEQTRTQLKKVVEISKHGSKEHIEAARLLQITELEHLNLTNHTAMFKQGMRKKTDSLGSIRLSNIRLKISSKLRNDLADDGVSHNFFCVASYGPEVKATEIINTNDIRKQDLKAHLQFSEQITFVDLPPDFIIKVEVFELVVGQHLPKLLSRLTPSKKTKITPDSNFKRIGSLKLTIADRDQSYKNLTQWSKHEESKFIERECKFHMELKPEQLKDKVGMLHVRCLDSVGRPDWSRFWVDSSGGQIRFWKSKQDSMDDKKPNQVLEFKDLCSTDVTKLTPNDSLYRQNSFVFYSFQQVAGGETDNLFQRVLKDDPKYKLVKHQLAADNKEECESWIKILDHSLNCFREWYGRTKIYSNEEIREIFLS